MVHLPPGPTSKPGPSGYLTSTRCLCSVGLHQKHASIPLMFPAPPVPLELPQAHFLYFICPCGAPAVSSRAYLPSHIRTARMGLTCQSYPASSSAVILLLGISVCDSKATDLDTSKLRIFLTPLTAHQVPILGMVPLPVWVLYLTSSSYNSFQRPKANISTWMDKVASIPAPLQIICFPARGIFSKHKSVTTPLLKEPF